MTDGLDPDLRQRLDRYLAFSDEEIVAYSLSGGKIALQVEMQRRLLVATSDLRAPIDRFERTSTRATTVVIWLTFLLDVLTVALVVVAVRV